MLIVSLSKLALLALLASLTLVVSQLHVARVSACSCNPNTELVWPSDGASTVERDLVVVLARWRADPPMPTARLVTDDGQEIAMELKQTTPGPETCIPQLMFLRVREPLEADTHYRLLVTTGVNSPEGAAELSRDLTTGSTERAQQDVEPLNLDYLRVLTHEDETCGERPCRDEVQLQIAGTSAASDEAPSWLIARVEKAGISSAIRRTRTQGIAMLRVLPEQQCIAYELVDARGDTREQGERCAPDHCLTIMHEGAREESTCKARRVAIDAETWAALPATSCKTLPVFVEEEDGKVVASPPAEETSGCTIGQAKRSWFGAACLLFALTCFMRRARNLAS